MRRIGPVFWPLLLIAVGAIFLLSNLGLLAFDPWQFWKLWPLILVVIGLDVLLQTVWRRGGRDSNRERDTSRERGSSRGHAEVLSAEVGALSDAGVSVEFGAGELRLGAGAAPGKLFDGEFTDDADFSLRGNRLRLRSHPEAWNWMWWGGQVRRWDVRLTEAIPLRLKLQVGACKADLNLRDLKVADLYLESGAADVRVQLPAAAGTTRASVKAGAASVVIGVPEGVAARIRATVAIGSFSADTRRFPRADGEYVSPDYATAANKVDLIVEGGVGSVVVS